jgi:hypothetical protein
VRHHVEPFGRLIRYYEAWARRQGADDDRAEEFAARVVYGKPSADGTELVNGYYQNPRWRPLGASALLGRLWERTAAEKHEVQSPAGSEHPALDRAPTAEATGWQTDDAPAVAWFRKSPEEVIVNLAEIDARRQSRAARERLNGPRWRSWIRQALSSLDDTNRAGGRSNRRWILDFGPWDLSPTPELLTLSSSPIPQKPRDERPPLRTTEGRALARARERYIQELARSAEHEDARHLVRDIAADPRNRLNEDTGQDLIDLIRVALGFRIATWLDALDTPAPLFLQEFAGASGALNLHVPSHVGTKAVAPARVADQE